MNPLRKQSYKNAENSWQWRLTFCGQFMAHSYFQYYVLDRIFKGNPQIKSVVEIGTGYGAMTIVLGLWGIKRGIPVLSLDHKPLYDQTLLKALGVELVKIDEFSAEAFDLVDGWIGDDPTFLICDGGNKVREFGIWAPCLPPGSIIATHDWGVEITPEDVRDVVADCGLEPYEPEWWDRMNVQFAIWRMP